MSKIIESVTKTFGLTPKVIPPPRLYSSIFRKFSYFLFYRLSKEIGRTSECQYKKDIAVIGINIKYTTHHKQQYPF